MVYIRKFNDFISIVSTLKGNLFLRMEMCKFVPAHENKPLKVEISPLRTLYTKT